MGGDFLAISVLPFITGCTQSGEAYVAAHQIVSDPLIFHVAGHHYLAKDRSGHLFLVETDDFGEAAVVHWFF